MAQSGGKKKVANSLLAVSSAAVLAVYAAGYARTRSAAERFAARAAERRPGIQGRAAPGSRIPRFVAAAPTTSAPAISPEEPASPKREDSPKGKSTLIASAERPGTTARVPASPAPTAAPAAPEPAAPAASVTPAVSAPATPAPPAAEPKPAIAAAPAAAPPAASAAVSKPAGPSLRDGTYFGMGSCRHGDIRAQVVVERGRITSATIADCMTRYSCDIIDKLPPEVVERQSPDVDYVSGATQSAEAFYDAVVDALSYAQ
jgi:uncharacterized protein with FMN-binding domain